MAGEEEREEVGQGLAKDTEDLKFSGEEEDTGAKVAPIAKLDVVAVSIGDENEDALIDLKAKLYQFDKENNH